VTKVRLEAKDTTVPDKHRRDHGEFYTPLPVVRLAHRYLDRELGPDWRERWIVWDPCCGTGNLTREYQFRDLVLTTLETVDIDLLREHQVNPGAVISQMDFLNDPVPERIRKRLRRAARKGRGIVFLMNPPFVGPGRGIGVKGAKEKGVVKTGWGNQLLLGRARTSLTVQFLFGCLEQARSYRFREVVVATFSALRVFVGPGFERAAELWSQYFDLRGGFVVPSRLFSGCKENWPIAFTIWRTTGGKIEAVAGRVGGGRWRAGQGGFTDVYGGEH